MLPWSWRYLFEAGPLRGVPPMYLFELLSHRVLRYASGFLHVGLLVDAHRARRARAGSTRPRSPRRRSGSLLAAAGKLKLRVPGAGIAWYYLLMTAATMAALVRYLREGAPLMWEKAEGTR